MSISGGYGAPNGLIGGLDGYLDKINGDNLAAGSIATASDGTYEYLYTLKEDGAAENPPWVIAPDTNAGDKRWHLLLKTMESIDGLPTALAGKLAASSNLSDLTSAPTARSNLGLAIGSDVQGYDADTLKSDVSRVRTRSHPGTCVALTDAATVTPDLTTGDSFTWAMGAARTLGNATIPGAGRWPILLTGNYTLSFNAAWAIDNAAVDPGTGTRVIWMYSVNGTEKRIRIEARA